MYEMRKFFCIKVCMIWKKGYPDCFASVSWSTLEDRISSIREAVSELKTTYNCSGLHLNGWKCFPHTISYIARPKLEKLFRSLWYSYKFLMNSVSISICNAGCTFIIGSFKFTCLNEIKSGPVSPRVVY